MMDFHAKVYECETQDNDPPLTDKDATQSLNSDGPRHSHDVIITDNQFHLLRAGLNKRTKSLLMEITDGRMRPISVQMC